ncbi:hypothetical protein BCR39DRAFT_462229 [Naematelia encephala]|uniref:Meiotically up-regulated protein Msb1/Mug8 domain-containing protein n=1 Tax=Naematelia encephala TaxID=71784 RepID=A0A1Y2BJP0_9TREE|nr:hypothetical protein BCR39DRAFT_462229 [Naematelia encephala]
MNVVVRTIAIRNTHPLTPPYSPDDSHTLDLPPILPPKYTFAPTWLPSAQTDFTSNDEDDELGSRSYGCLGGVGAKVTLSIDEVGKVLRDVGDELMRRGLTIPMLFSNQALELNQVRTKHIIQTYLETLSNRQPSKHRSESFKQDILYAKEHELAWLLRWALSHLARIREGTREVLRGMIEWDVYEEWRGREKSANYRSDAYPHLSALVPTEIYQLLLTPLLHLLSRFAAHSYLSGLTPHALASLFSPFVFNVSVSAPAMIAHSQYVRAASATEHLLLAYIRSSGRRDGLGIADLPTRLAAWVKGYPAMIAKDEELARGGPRRGAKVVRCERASRIVRAYSRDLIVTAELWAQDIISENGNGNGDGKWEAWDRVVIRDKKGEAGRPRFSNSWKRKMSVKETLPLPSSSSSGLQRTSTYGKAEKPGSQLREKEGRKRRDDTRGDEDAARWDSVAGKEWSMFEEGGFDMPELRGSVDLQGRLKFDLTESAKLTISERRQTMDWTEFASPSGGFNRTDPQLATSLGFADPISESITHWPETREDIRKRLHKSQKEAVPFNYDTSVKIGTGIQDTEGTLVGMDDKGRVYVEEAFVDFWADLVVGAKWGDREELTFKESNWALIEYKAKPSRPDGSTSIHPLSDPRTSTLYFLFEERVPLEYQLAIANPHQKKTFGSLFSPRRKRTPTKQTNEELRQTLGTGWQDNDFDRMLLHRTQTKRITLNKTDQPTVWQWTSEQQSNRNSPTRIFKRDSPPTHDEFGISDGKANFFSKGKQRNSSRRNKVHQGVKQREQQLEYEIASASGGDSPNSGINDNDNDNGKKKDDKWMGTFFCSSAKGFFVRLTG